MKVSSIFSKKDNFPGFPDFPDITRPYPDFTEDFEEDED